MGRRVPFQPGTEHLFRAIELTITDKESLTHTMVRDVRIVLSRNRLPGGTIIFTHEDIVLAHARNTNEYSACSLRVLLARVERYPANAHDIRAIA